MQRICAQAIAIAALLVETFFMTAAAAQSAQPAEAVPKVQSEIPASVEGNASGSGVPVAASEGPVTTVSEKKFSYGEANVSVLFAPDQIERLKQAIRTFENTNLDANSATSVATYPVVTVTAEEINEPSEYPVFYLASIVYNTPEDWSIWVSGQKITSHKNNTDVTVIKVTREAVTFLWRPRYIKAINRRYETQSFAPTDAVKNKLVVAQRMQLDPATGAITFTLEQNQSFAVGYFKLFEGYVDNPKLEALSKALFSNNTEDASLATPLPANPLTASGADTNVGGDMPLQNVQNPSELPVPGAASLVPPASTALAP